MKFTFELDAAYFDTAEKVGAVLVDLGAALQRFGDVGIDEPVESGGFFRNQLRNRATNAIVGRSAVVDEPFDATAWEPSEYTSTCSLGAGGADLRPLQPKEEAQ